MALFIENPSQIKWNLIGKYCTIKNALVIDLSLDVVFTGEIQISISAYEQILIRKTSTKMESDWYISMKYPIEVYELQERPLF